MAINVYLMPAVGTGTRADPKTSKYADTFTANGVSFSQMDYGAEPVFLVAARDVPAGVHSTISADSTCVTVPDLQQSVGAQVAAVQSVLEAMKIPAGWVGSAMSYGSVVRVVAVVFQLFQRLQGQGVPRLFGGTVTLDTQFNQLPVATRNQLVAMAQSFNFDTTGMSGTTKIRTILKALADQWPNISIGVGSLTL